MESVVPMLQKMELVTNESTEGIKVFFSVSGSKKGVSVNYRNKLILVGIMIPYFLHDKTLKITCFNYCNGSAAENE